jgi:hypothetical protein
MPLEWSNPREFELLARALPEPLYHEKGDITLRDICWIAEGISSDLRGLRENLDDLKNVDIVFLAGIVSKVEELQSLQLSIIKQNASTIQESSVIKMEQDFQNMFLLGTGKSKSTGDVLMNFQKYVDKGDYTGFAIMAANCETYLRGYILAPLKETQAKLLNDSKRVFAERSAERSGVVPQYAQKPGMGTPGQIQLPKKVVPGGG